MTAIIKNNFRIQNAKDFLKNLVDGSNNAYTFIGKPLPFINATNIQPPIPKDSLDDERRIWDEMLALKKITKESMSLVVPRYNWESGIIYDIFDDKDGQLYSKKYYVINSLFEVFVCIENNNDSESTVMPFRQSNPNEIVSTADHYVWKYMTTIKTGDAVKFLTDSWMPVKTLEQHILNNQPVREDPDSPQWSVQDGAIPGTILSIQVKNPGEGYRNVEGNSLSVNYTIASSNTLSKNVNLTNLDLSNLAGYSLYKISNTKLEHVAKIISSTINTITLDLETISLTNDAWKILPTVELITNKAEIDSILIPTMINDKIESIDFSSLENNQDLFFAKIKISPTVNISAICDCIISPREGLGGDIEKDLGARFVMINTKLKFDENDDFPLDNDFRQIGIVQNIQSINSQNDDTLNATKSIKVSTLNGNLNLDEEIYQESSGAKGILIGKKNIADGNLQLFYIQTPETGYVNFSSTNDNSADNMKIKQGNSSCIVVSLLNSEIVKFSGNILYVENRRAILRAPSQIEDIKTIIEF